MLVLPPFVFTHSFCSQEPTIHYDILVFNISLADLSCSAFAVNLYTSHILHKM
jgi:hypothetical protein